ncbi:MAG: ABC transporter substrate-binding protein [Eubacterium sp.]|nr:ABC transporter substrate-binding protein [Eubacterium sp.]
MSNGKKKKPAAVFALLLVICMIITGCTPATSTIEGAGDIGVHTELIRVGFSQLGAESDWRRANTESIRASLTREAGYQLIFEDAQQKQSNQTMAIRRFIQQGVDYIVVAPMTEQGWDNVLNEAKDAGIPVILVDRQIRVKDPTLFTCHIGSDFRLEGDKVCAWLKKFIKTRGLKPSAVHIADLQGTVGATAQIGRSASLTAAAKRNKWDVVAREDGDFTQAKGKEVTTRILAEFPNVNVLYCENDNMALGAIDAIESSGRRVGSDIENGEILILSFDGVSNEAIEALKQGKIACIGECYPMHGPYVTSAIEMIESGKKPDRESYVTESIYSADSSITQVSVGEKDYSVTIIS